MFYKNEKSALFQSLNKEQFIEQFENNIQNFDMYWNKLELPNNAEQNIINQKKVVFKELVYNLFSEQDIVNLNNDQFDIIWKIFQNLFINSMLLKWNHDQAHQFFEKEVLLYSCDRVWMIKKQFDLDQIIQISKVFYENFLSKLLMYQECFSTQKNQVIEIKFQEQQKQQNMIQQKPRLLSQDSILEKENKIRKKILKEAEQQFRQEVFNNQFISLQFEMKTVLIFLLTYSVLSLDLSAVSDIPLRMYETKKSIMEKELRKVYETELQGVTTKQKLTKQDNFTDSLLFVHNEIKKIQDAKVKIKAFNTIETIKKYNKRLNQKKKVKKQKKKQNKKISRKLINKHKKKNKREKVKKHNKRKLIQSNSKTSSYENQRRKLLQKFHDLDSKDQMKKIKRIYQNYGINIKKLGVKDLKFLIQNTKKLLKKYYKDDQKKRRRRRRERKLSKKSSKKKHKKRKHKKHRERKLSKKKQNISYTKFINSKVAKEVAQNPNGKASQDLMRAIDPSVAEQMIKKKQKKTVQRNLKQISKRSKKTLKKQKKSKKHKKNRKLQGNENKQQKKSTKNLKNKKKTSKKLKSKKIKKNVSKKIDKKLIQHKTKKQVQKALKKKKKSKKQKKKVHRKQRKLQLQPQMPMSPELQQQYYQQMMKQNPQLYQQYYQQAQMMQQQQAQQGQQQQQYPQMSQEQYNQLYQQYAKSQKTQQLSPKLMKKLYPQYYNQPYQAQQQQSQQLGQGRLLSFKQDKKGLKGSQKLLNSIQKKLKDPDLIRDLKNEMNRGKNLRITNVNTTITNNVSAKQIQGFTRGLFKTNPEQIARKMYSGFAKPTLPPIPLRKGGGSSSFYGMNELTGGQMAIKFPDDPPVVFMTQQPFYSYI